MRRIETWAPVVLAAFLIAHGARAGERCLLGKPLRCPSPPYVVLGACEMPVRLPGRWKVSMCIEVVCTDTGHTWLRYQNLETGEVHTAGRYQKNHGGRRSKETGEMVFPPAPVSGVIFDLDLRRENLVRSGQAHMLSCIVEDPIVFRGINGGLGHGGRRNNCVTHVRDGWHYFTGEYYELGEEVHAPNELLQEVAKRHPEVK